MPFPHRRNSVRLRSFLFTLALLALLHFYIGSRLLPNLSAGAAGWTIGVLVLAASCILMPLSMLTRSLERKTLADRITWAGMLLMGLFSSLLVLTLLRDLFLLVAGLVATAAAVTDRRDSNQ